MARPVCSVCGSGITIGQLTCTSCGASIEWGNATLPSQGSSPARPRAEVCPVCGFTNDHGGEACESCGARLPGTMIVEKPPEQSPPAERKKPRPEKAPKRKKYQRESHQERKVDPYVAGAAAVVIAVVGIFVYSELTREPPPGDPGTATPETSSQMAEVDRLQSAVDRNPSDVGSLLRLANVLHDLSLKDTRLLPRSVDAYTKYLAQRPDDPNARVDLGIVYFELSKVDATNRSELEEKSIHEMETVASANPGHQPAAFNLGIVTMNVGRREEARAWFSKAIEINPNSDLGIRAKKVLQEVP